MARQRKSSTARHEADGALDGDPLWYKDVVIYQLHVRSFFDSNNDGIGDFAGLTRKLDYLQDLGVTALWLLPFYPSPLRDDGYDIADYTRVNRVYGDLGAFKKFIHEAHARSLRVITELVINHTSDQHPWFQRARRAKPGSPEREFYVWSDTPDKYRGTRVIFKDFEVSNWSWDPLAKAYYWHRFYSHQPDLNFDNPLVRQAVFDVLDFWLDLGVDGLRLDAVPYLYEREGTNCENLPETHAFLKELRRRVSARYPGRMLLAEANQWPEDAIAYFGDGDECQTAFHFPVMPRLFMSIHMEDRFPIVDILQQTPPIPPDCQWLIFLRNHDELTLEMVTDEERDYMYRVYARDVQARINLGIRRRLAPLLGNNRRKIELMNGLLCSLPGTPVIYYGDEIGMGDNIYLGDRNGVRTPMQWSPDRNAGFSEANPQQLYSPLIIDSEYLFETINVETQQANPHSLLWWMRRLIAMRGRYRALQRGGLELLAPDNPKVLAFLRILDDECVLMVANLSRFPQFVELDLSRFAGRRPMELFGQTQFPPIGKSAYVLTLGPHAFFWFALPAETADTAGVTKADWEPANLTIPSGVDELTRRRVRKMFGGILAREFCRRGWSLNPHQTVQALQIADAVPTGKPTDLRLLVWVPFDVDYREGESEKYMLPVVTAWEPPGDGAPEVAEASILARVERPDGGQHGVTFDASGDSQMASELLATMLRRRRWKGGQHQIVGWAASSLARGLPADGIGRPSLVRSDRGGSWFTFGDKLLLKLFRKLEPGLNPDIEITRFLTSKAVGYAHTLPVLGLVEYRSLDGAPPSTVAALHSYAANMISGWQFAGDALGRFFEHASTLPAAELPSAVAAPRPSLWQLAAGETSDTVKSLLGATLEWAALLGRRTAELHLALSSDPLNPSFAPEPFTQHYQRSLYQSWRRLALRTLGNLRQKQLSLPAEAQPIAQRVLEHEREILETFRGVVGKNLVGSRIRCHGKFHLDHVLYSGKDFLIVDFEGDSSRPLSWRLIKRTPLEDVAGMVHSFQTAASSARLSPSHSAILPPNAGEALADFWYLWTSSAFLRAYAAIVAKSDLMPTDVKQLDMLLHLHLLERAINELEFELNYNLDRTLTPLKRIVQLQGG